MVAASGFDADRMIAVRKARNLGRRRVAKLNGPAERSVGRLEGGSRHAGGVMSEIVSRIAVALQVAPEILTVAAPMCETILREPTMAGRCQSSCCS